MTYLPPHPSPLPQGARERTRVAFTLAEVLITLGIIGVVAAMTIPSLMTAYKKHKIETQLKQFYSTFNQAIKLSEAENDDMEGWDWPIEESGVLEENTDYEWYQKYLQPYLKNYTYNSKIHIAYVWYDGFLLKSINGTGAACGVVEAGHASGHFVCLFFPNSNDIEKIDSRGASDTDTDPNISLVPGKNYFMFEIVRDNLSKKGLQPYNSDSCTQKAGLKGLPSPGCAKLIKDNGWKIPDNYPIKL